ncbi:hypothetical protein CCP1ISM_20010 [Azospirillaceae bacterium]
MISIDYIEFRNFLGYGDYVTRLQFNKYGGIALILGQFEENNNPGDERRCGAGKTSIIEAIVWCLFGGLTTIEKPGDKVVNWNTGKNCFVKIRTTDGYEIIRTRKMVGSNELVVLKDGEDVTRSTATPSQEFINNTFKIDYRTFVVSVVFGQLSEGFLSVSDAKRRSIFERFIKITSFNAIAATAKEKVSKLDIDIASLETKVDNLNSSKTSIELEIDGLLVKVKEFDANKNTQIDAVKSKLNTAKLNTDSEINNIKSSIETVNEKIKNFVLTDIEDIRYEWTRYEDFRTQNEKRSLKKAELIQLKSRFDSKLSSIISEIKSNKDELSRIKIVEEEPLSNEWKKYNSSISNIRILRSKLEEVNKSINNSEYKIDKLKIDIENIVDVKSLQTCDKCYNPITGEHIEKVIVEKRSELDLLNSKVPELTEAVTRIRTKISELESVDEPEMTLDDLHKNIAKVAELSPKIESLDSTRIKLMAAVKDAQNQIDSIEMINLVKPSMTIDEAVNQKNIYDNLKKDVESKESNISKAKDGFKQKIIDAQTEINKIRASENPYTTMVSGKKSKLDNLLVEISSESEELNKSKKIRQHLNYIKDNYANKKKMRAFWIGEIIPTLNKFIRYYFDVFEIEDKIEFDEFLNVKTDKWDFATHSGGEKKEIDLSIMFALNDMHSSVFGQQSNFMVLDEVDGRVDPFITNRLVTLLNDDIIKRGNGLTNIFIISHRETMKDRFPHKIKVKNKGGNAYIVDE